MGATVAGVREEGPRVPVGVLTPVVRRRRRRVGAEVALLVLVLGAAAGVAALLHARSAHPAAAAPRRAPVVRAGTPAHPRRNAPERARSAALLMGPPRTARPLRPPIAARAAIVVDAGSGAVLWGRHPHRRLPVASTTKIMTAFLALDRLRAEAFVRVPPAATRVPLVREGLRPRERVRAWKLFDGLLVYSGNDDALTLAVATAGTRRAFLVQMNEKARELGLDDSHFSSASGVIDRDNYSSAWDLAALTRVALRNPRFRRIVRRRIVHVPWSAPTYEKVYVNKNPLLGSYRGANGVKTGWTTLAGHCLVASATRHGRTIIAVVLHDADATGDSRRLLDLGFQTDA
jgi:serine-type D-Ala-D-Ala carboxypeptidase (penicillin-binding protein 5/6)